MNKLEDLNYNEMRLSCHHQSYSISKSPSSRQSRHILPKSQSYSIWWLTLVTITATWENTTYWWHPDTELQDVADTVHHSTSGKIQTCNADYVGRRGGLKMQDLKMEDQKRSVTLKCRTWKCGTTETGPENGGQAAESDYI